MKTISRKLRLGKIAYDGKRRSNATELELTLRWHEGSAQTTDLEPVEGYWSLSICGGIWDSRETDLVACGQNVDEVAGFFPGDARVQRIKAIWDRWHLNDIKAGTRAQSEFLDNWLKQSGERYDYTKVCVALDTAGLLVDRGYKYGSAWLVEVVPAEVLLEVRGLF